MAHPMRSGGYALVCAYALTGLLGVLSGVLGNSEFLLYTAVALVATILVHLGARRFLFSAALVWGYVVWLVLHMLGGLLPVGDGVLYSWVVIPIAGAPYHILKYDQVVHIGCYFLIALMLFQIVRGAASRLGFGILSVTVMLAACGVGTLNEIIEFAATVILTDTNVGDYTNTALDLVANMVGAVLAMPVMHRQYHSGTDKAPGTAAKSMSGMDRRS